MHKNEITEEELRKSYYDKLIRLSKLEQLEYNEMAKMLSTSNCWYATYHAGRIVHDELIKIWYPERINNQNK